jgi:hypothetical protein
VTDSIRVQSVCPGDRSCELDIRLSASSPELIWIRGEINSDGRVWNRSQSVNFSARFETSGDRSPGCQAECHPTV